jgi:hypothetical protein
MKHSAIQRSRNRRAAAARRAAGPSVKASTTAPVADGAHAASPVSRLARQEIDFTAEGSPPPGRVALAAPEEPDGAPVAAQAAAT